MICGLRCWRAKDMRRGQCKGRGIEQEQQEEICNTALTITKRLFDISFVPPDPPGNKACRKSVHRNGSSYTCITLSST